MKKVTSTLFATAAFVLAGNAMGACTWNAVAVNGMSSADSTWAVESGTPAAGQTRPAAGDNIVIPAGKKVWFDESTDFVNVTIQGEICGADNSIATTPIAIVHRWQNLTFSGDSVAELADGRKLGTVTYEVANMTISDNSQLTGCRFVAATKAEQTVPILKISGDVNWSTTKGFPIYPVNFGGSFYPVARLEFAGTNASTFTLPGKSTEFSAVTIPAGKTVTFKGKNVYIGKDMQIEASGDFRIFGTAKFETPSFVWGDGKIVVKDGGIIGTDFAGGIVEAPWGEGPIFGCGLPVLEAGSGIMFYGTAIQTTGTGMPANVDVLVLDKSVGALSLDANLSVKGLSLTNGTLNTGAFTLAGPQAGKLVQGNGAVNGNWAPYASVSDWSQF